MFGIADNIKQEIKELNMSTSDDIKVLLVNKYGGQQKGWKRYHCKFYTVDGQLIELRKFYYDHEKMPIGSPDARWVAVADIIKRGGGFEFEVLSSKDEKSIYQGEAASGQRFAIDAPDAVFTGKSEIEL